MSGADAGVPAAEVVESWSPEQRAEMARMLDRLVERPVPGRTAPHRRLLVLLVTLGGAALLFPWVAYLSAALPESSSGGSWRTAWVGYDVILAVALATAGWLVWHRRQLAVVALSVAATLVLVDAWFDVTLSWGTSEQWGAVLTAALVEIPVASVLAVGVVGMLRRTVAMMRRLRGQDPSMGSLWSQPSVVRPVHDGAERSLPAGR